MLLDRMIGDVIIIVCYTMAIILLVFTAKYYLDKQNISDLTFSLVQHVSTSGKLTTATYDRYRGDINKVGKFQVVVKYSKRLDDEIYDHIFDLSDILDRRMDSDDEISISAVQVNEPLIGKLFNFLTLFSRADSKINARIEILYSAKVDSRPKDIVEGYDVIADIKAHLSIANTKIFVATKLNTAGKLYASEAYGDSADETQPYGDNYIHPSGEFRKEKILNADNTVTINYYQVH